MIKIYTDGSCRGNPGPGGWAAIIFIDNKKIKIKGKKINTTNNQMELTAPIKALKKYLLVQKYKSLLTQNMLKWE